MHKVIITLWLFWLETLAFIGFVYWSVWARVTDARFTTYHKLTFIVYTLALLITLYGTWLFIRRRFFSQ